MSNDSSVASSKQHGAEVMEGTDHLTAREHRGSLLGRRPLGHREGEGPLLVEAERVDAVDDDLASE